MVLERLKKWSSHRGQSPANILYYRDGVGNKQYPDIKTMEIPQIQAAWKEFDPTGSPIPLTVVIVTKRHNTRFYPVRSDDTMSYNENCRPGTLVDSIVTSPYFVDFFLQSHNGLKGTARSAHYFVLQNGMGLSTVKLQDFVSIFFNELFQILLICSNLDAFSLSYICSSHSRSLIRIAGILR